MAQVIHSAGDLSQYQQQEQHVVVGGTAQVLPGSQIPQTTTVLPGTFAHLPMHGGVVDPKAIKHERSRSLDMLGDQVNRAREHLTYSSEGRKKHLVMQFEMEGAQIRAGVECRKMQAFMLLDQQYQEQKMQIEKIYQEQRMGIEMTGQQLMMQAKQARMQHEQQEKMAKVAARFGGMGQPMPFMGATHQQVPTMSFMPTQQVLPQQSYVVHNGQPMVQQVAQ